MSQVEDIYSLSSPCRLFTKLTFHVGPSTPAIESHVAPRPCNVQECSPLFTSSPRLYIGQPVVIVQSPLT